MSGARYSLGGDEFIFVEMSESMSLDAYSRSIAITNALRERALDGVIDICPANASYQVRYDPDRISAAELEGVLRELEVDVETGGALTFETRILEIPVYFDDPWTRETLMRFRNFHQDPDATDLEYAASVNGMSSPQEFIDAYTSAPWLASMVGFVAGLPFLYQTVPNERQLQVPKYVRPRTDTPALTIGHGGCFGCIYSVRGAGGYQMFGITPVPIYDPTGELPDFRDFVCFFRPGDIVQFQSIDRDRYDEIRDEVEQGTVSIRQRPTSFSLSEWNADPDAYNSRLLEVLRAD